MVLLDAVLNSFQVLLLSSDIIFPMLSIASGTFVEHFSFINESVMQMLILFFATLYILNLSNKLRARLQNGDSDA